MKNIGNEEIVKILEEIAGYLDMDGEDYFRVKAYEKAAQGVASLNKEAVDLYQEGGLKALEEIPGVGKGIAEKIEELFKTGHVKYYKEVKKIVPVNLSELMSIEGLGPKNIKKLYQELKIKDLKSLEKAARAGKISQLEGFGKKSEENILKGIEFVKKSGGRFLLSAARSVALEIEERLKKLRGVKNVVIAGSVRRWKETIGDIDILIVADKPKPIMDFFVSMPEVGRVYAHGKTKSAIKLKSGLDVDLRVVSEESYGAALNYFTGSKDHNIALRQIAIDKGYKLNEYGLFKGKKQISGKTEEELYKALGLHYIDPELREVRGEIEAASVNGLPKLVGYGELKGDLQVQTNWTDGADSIETMARAAMQLGLEYILITDHTKRLAMTGGLDEKRIVEQMEEIDKLNKKFEKDGFKFKILKGTECDIHKDGALDMPDNILARLDVVGVAVHSYFNLPGKEQTERIIKAISNPHADILFHPTGRIINRRPAYDLDMDKIIEVAKKTGTILEIDAFPDRLDLKDDYIKKCVEMGIKMSISSDSHSQQHFSVLEYGIAQARRGWATKNDIINAWPLEKMLSFIKDSE